MVQRFCLLYLKIVSGVTEPLFIVISAMGKTTNALEVVLEQFMKANHTASLEKLAEVETYHHEIISELFVDAETGKESVKPLFDELRQFIIDEVSKNPGHLGSSLCAALTMACG